MKVTPNSRTERIELLSRLSKMEEHRNSLCKNSSEFPPMTSVVSVVSFHGSSSVDLEFAERDNHGIPFSPVKRNK